MTPSPTSDDVAQTAFKKICLGERYDVDDVDDAMSRATAALRAWEARHAPTMMASMSAATAGRSILTSRELVDMRFGIVRVPMRAGYDGEEVDEFLDEVAVALKGWESEAPRL